MSFQILGTGSALPARSVTNDELSAFLDTSDEWIFTRTGIKSRRVCTTETLDDLAVEASRRAVEAAEVDPTELDLIVCSTTTGDHLLPAEACAVAERLGASCPAFDVSGACAGFVLALDVADGYIARGRARRVLAVAAEQMSRVLDWTDRSTCVLFGDGAGAAVIEAPDAPSAACAAGSTVASPAPNPLSMRFTTDPSVAVLNVPGVAGTSPFAEAPRRASALSMDGRRVFRFGVAAICDAVEAMASDAGIAVADIDHLVFHQANERILAAAIKRLGIDGSRVVRTLRDTGNISSACIPLALDRLARAGELKGGDLVALVGFGAGLDIGACLLRWK